ncbi:C40 family peptidase [Dyella mobilis]|uniref:C40 family peptidase n=1 Tax=Dyella mobilis TaxID=1849582 RepID=A0ABS2KLE9_9GAMM|nr:C40 family peptidase [Dyella mobilis]MBM7131991.1 C40 family peptidase [Dyella mobilis]GLQ96025.1 lipoprotein [Dyella mobilis]
MALASTGDADKYRSCRTALRRAALVGLASLLAACAGSPRREATYKPSESQLANEPARAPENSVGTANDVLFRAMALVGTPYHWGGNTPESGFDCSGLVDYIYRNAANIQLPHSSRDMAVVNGEKVRSMDDLISGDLVFFGSRGGISHVGVYVGKGRFVHAPNSGGTVRLDDIDGPYWRDHFVYGKRLLD